MSVKIELEFDNIKDATATLEALATIHGTKTLTATVEEV